jgi:6-pyruvoyltetrahydropterin/6-carboxytetrahydropterin synthase
MPIAYITRRERFNAAHRLFNAELSDEENLRLYGKCSHPNWHGHNFELFVTIKGEIDKKSGFVTNLTSLSTLIRELVIDKLDHRNINLDVDFMKGQIVSTENLAVAIWFVLKQPIEKIGVKLHCVKIQETENNFVEYFGE